MKTLKIICFLFLLSLLVTCKKDEETGGQGSQALVGATLRNTLWASRNSSDNHWEKYFYFGHDTLITSSDSVNWTPNHYYSTNFNMFSISDFSNLICSFGDTGKYNYSVVSDTLRFTTISDGCGLRSGYLNAHYFVRQ